MVFQTVEDALERGLADIGRAFDSKFTLVLSGGDEKVVLATLENQPREHERTTAGAAGFVDYSALSVTCEYIARDLVLNATVQTSLGMKQVSGVEYPTLSSTWLVLSPYDGNKIIGTGKARFIREI